MSERPPSVTAAAPMGALRAALGAVIGLVVWIWVRTLSVVIDSAAETALTAELPGRATGPRRSRALAFFHGQQMALLAVRRTANTAVIVSRSKDGDVQAAVMGRLGFRVTRGSSSRGGARGLLALVRLLRDGLDAAVAVDGPRGPRGVPKPGVALAARRSGAALVPVASAASRKIVLRHAWDAFEIPLPFSRVAVVLGAPVSADVAARDPEALGAAISAARVRACQLVLGKRAAGVEAPRESPEPALAEEARCHAASR